MDEAESIAKVYQGDWTAHWLLSGIHDHVWIISKGEETRQIEGKVVGAWRFSWACMLPNGELLTEPAHCRFLTGLQRLAFLARVVPGGPDALESHRNFLIDLLTLTRWLYLHAEVVAPDVAMMTRLTKSMLHDYFRGLAEGGVAWVLQYPQRFLAAIYPRVLNRAPSAAEMADPFSLDRDARERIAAWLETEGYLKLVGRGHSDRYLDRAFVATLVNADEKTTKHNPRWSAFLDQFVPVLSTSSSQATSSRADTYAKRTPKSRKEFPGHRALTDSEAKEHRASHMTMERHLTSLRGVFSLHRHLSTFIPDPDIFHPGELTRGIEDIAKPSLHTPWVPLSVALRYTTESLRWVHVYGEHLVSFFLETYRSLHKEGLLASATQIRFTAPGREFAARQDEYVSRLAVPASLQPLRLEGWGTYWSIPGEKAFAKLRRSPSLQDAILVLLGAIATVVGILKPLRESELRSLRRNCLHAARDSGYWLFHDLRKKNIGDTRPIEARPIPTIAAKAILLLKQLTDGIKETLGVTDPWLLDHLFALPQFGRFEAEIGRVLTAAGLASVLDVFCDYIALPPDHAGRRWYLRVHEMRKSFLIVFFWTYRYASLEAARWMAGHGDASHIYAYIEANFPGQELPTLEAQYACKVLREYGASRLSEEAQGVDELYRWVCNQFHVTDVSWLEEETLCDWLDARRRANEFDIRPYSIISEEGSMTTRIAFRVRPLEERNS